MHRWNRVALLLLALGVGAPAAQAADPNTPQGHQGKLKPYTRAPAAVKLTPAEEQRLQAGEAILRTTEGTEGGTGVAVQLIAAPPEVIWRTILSYDQYTRWVDNVESCTVYKKEGKVWYVDMKTSVMGFESGVYTRNVVNQAEGWMAWTLDYSRKSDVDDLIGYWRVESISTTPPLSRLDYATELKVSGVPSFLVRYLTRESLTDGTAWVKKQAEATLR